jgi:two-component system chemotaxis response regulator CheB
MPAMAEGRDIIVIGGSAGAINALSEILPGLDRGLPAAVLVVIHSGQESPGFLANILQRNTSIAVRYAEDREPLELGAVYLAPPDRHLLIKPGELRVVRGPKENNFRPAIDPLFRSAAYTYGTRVIGVLLSGLLDDGTYGMLQIKQQGGLLIAQSPNDASQSDMPLSAIERVGVDRVAAAADIAAVLNEVVHADVDSSAGPAREQTDVAEGLVSGLRINDGQPPSSPFVCPECGGSLWEQREGEGLRYRCHTGHGFTAATLSALQSDELEQALWTSVRLLDEQAELQRRMAGRWQTDGNVKVRARFESNAEDREHAADLIRTLLTGQSEGLGKTEAGPNILREYGT